jgi:hypothetical protein
MGGAPSALAFVTNEDSSQLELFAVDGSRTRVAVLRATGAGLDAPVAAVDLVSVPTFWESLRHRAPYATSAADAWSHAVPRGEETAAAVVARDGIDRASGPLLHGIAMMRLDNNNESVACVQLTSDGDVYRTVMTRSPHEPVASEPRRVVCARLDAVRFRRDSSRTEVVAYFHHVSSMDRDLAAASGRNNAHESEKTANLVLSQAVETLQQHPCSVYELARELRWPVERLAELLQRGERDGMLASMTHNEQMSGDVLLDQLQTVYYVPSNEANLAIADCN